MNRLGKILPLASAIVLSVLTFSLLLGILVYGAILLVEPNIYLLLGEISLLVFTTPLLVKEFLKETCEWRRIYEI